MRPSLRRPLTRRLSRNPATRISPPGACPARSTAPWPTACCGSGEHEVEGHRDARPHPRFHLPVRYPAFGNHSKGLPVLLSGDTLFAGTIGRTDFKGGSMADMRASLRSSRRCPTTRRSFPATTTSPPSAPSAAASSPSTAIPSRSFFKKNTAVCLIDGVS